MTKRVVLIAVLTMLLSAVFVLSASARIDPKLDGPINQAEWVDQFDLQKHSRAVNAQPLTRDQLKDRLLRLPLGITAANAGIGIGEVIDNTYNDFQTSIHDHRQIVSGYDYHSGTSVGVEVHFVYEELSAIDSASEVTHPVDKLGYNFYNASNTPGSNWPEGQEAGCQLDALHQWGGGRQMSIDVLPDGRVVFGAVSDMFSEHEGEDDSTTIMDNIMFFQQDKSSFNRCYWDSITNVSHIAPAQYQVGWVSETGDEDTTWPARDPILATQIIGPDTIIHCIMGENGYTILGSPYALTQSYMTYSYFRKIGTATPGSWTGPTVLDTNFFHGMALAASPVSSKVAVSTVKISLLGNLNDNWDDNDVFFKESTDGGLTWPTSMTNITNFPRNVASYTANWEIECMYDHNDNLHILYAGQPCPGDPYRGGYHWPDFTRDLFHWSRAIPGDDAGGTTSMIANGSYDVNPAACSFGGYNAGNISFYNLTECDGNLYATWNQWHFRVLTLGVVPEAYNDCPATIEDNVLSSNAEIIMSVSSSLDGLLWDAGRNLTNTYTPGCDSLGGEGGPCGDENKPMAEMHALDVSGLGTLTWPSAARVDAGELVGLPTYTGDWFFNVQYQDDLFPGPWWQGDSEFATLNSHKWLRIACVNPVEAPQIETDPAEISWPRWQRYNEDSAYTITVTNQGNVPLVVTEIATSGEAWLGTSAASMTVTAGAAPDNQGTFDIQVNTAGFSAPQFLDGEVYMISNVEPTAPATVDTLAVTIHLLVADTVEPIIWDTVATSSAWDDKSATASGDNTALAMGNHGEMGQNGQLGVNLDFGVDGGDPGDRGRDSMYLYTGGMFILQNNGGGDVAITTSVQQADQAFGATSNAYNEHGFDPVPDAGSMTSGIRNDGGGDIYDSVFAGRMANRDTSIYVERTYYAPRNMSSTFPNFVVVKSKVFTGTKGAQTGLSIGDVMDWDIPTDRPPNNVSAASVTADVTYIQGSLDPDSSFAWDNSARFAAEAMMGWGTTNVVGDCSSESRDYHGSFGTFQPFVDDTLISTTYAQPDAVAWLDSVSFYNYNSGNATDTDQAVWMTYVHDYSLTDSDTLYFYTAFAMVKQGTVGDLEATIAAAYDFYFYTIRSCFEGCCLPPTVGDCDQSGGVDITDISVLIDNQFLTLTPLVCEAEGDVDFSGGVDITDLSVLIDNQFLTLTPLKDCEGNPVP